MGWIDNIKGKKETDAAKEVMKMIPDKLKDKTADEITALLNAAPDLQAKVADLEAKSIQDIAAVTAIKTEFESVKARLIAAEANRNKKDNPLPEERADFIDDPDKAFNQRVAPLAEVTIKTAATTARMLAHQTLNNHDMASGGKSMDGRLFQAWSVEIDTEASKYPTSNLMTVDSWLGMYFLIKGRHADELANPEERKKKYNFLEPGASSQQAPPEIKKKDGVDGLTDEEKTIATKMGVSHENYAKRKSNMKFVNA